MPFPKSKTIVAHIIGWLLFSGLIISFTSLSPNGAYNPAHLFRVSYLVFFAVFIVLFYLNAYFLFPRFYLQKKYFVYFSLILLFLVTVFISRPYDTLVSNHGPQQTPSGRNPPPNFRKPPAAENRQPPPENMKFQQPRNSPVIDIVSVILFIMIVALSSAMQLIKQWQKTNERVLRAEADKATAELSFLKAQINPHFLFNTLNNIYSMAVSKSEATADSIMKLSNIMRYVTDEINDDYVSLGEEVSCIKDYIDLQKMRLSNQAEVNFEVEGNMESKQIAPLVLMTFIENVFKYGISNHEAFTIDIKLQVNRETILFFCQNQIFSRPGKVERTGIGIANTRQRLDHLYPGKYSLDITEDPNLFTVKLELEA